MAAEDVLPEGVCSSLAQLVERVAADPLEVASGAILMSKFSALRRCFDDAVSRILTAHNARNLVVPDDIWLLVLEHLSLDDLLSASRACRRWRAVSLAHSRLWTRLILRMDAGGPGTYRTNKSVLKNILPRARDHLLDLDVRITISDHVDGYDTEIQEFLDLVAPRLVRLNLASVVPSLVGPVISEYFTVFPEHQ